MILDPNRPVGYESRKSYARRCAEGYLESRKAQNFPLIKKK